MVLNYDSLAVTKSFGMKGCKLHERLGTFPKPAMPLYHPRNRFHSHRWVPVLARSIAMDWYAAYCAFVLM